MLFTLGQAKFHHLMVTASHSGKLQQLDISKLMSGFILRNGERRKKFVVPH